MNARIVGWLAAALAIAGCGGNVSQDAAAPASGGTAGSGGTGGTPSFGGASGVCDATAEALAQKLGGAGVSCTSVVRLSASNFAIENYALRCGNYSKLDQQAALDQAKADTGYTAPCMQSDSLTGVSPADDFVFFHPSIPFCDNVCCGNGWLTAVGARNGLTLLGEAVPTTSAPGTKFPPSWDPATDLGSGCTPPFSPPPARGFDLTGTDATPPPALDDATMKSALDAIWHSALPQALAKKQSIFDAVVLLTRTSYGESSPEELVVFVNSGWLE